MRKTVRNSPTHMPTLLVSSVGSRRFFPAWIDSDDRMSALTMGAGIVLPRVRDSLPLRRVFPNAADSVAAVNRRLSDARRLR